MSGLEKYILIVTDPSFWDQLKQGLSAAGIFSNFSVEEVHHMNDRFFQNSLRTIGNDSAIRVDVALLMYRTHIDIVL